MITQAAIRRGDEVITGRRHCDCIKAAMARGWKPPVTQKEQGFVDDTGRYYNRKQAKIEAFRCGQITQSYFESQRKLLSEDLW